MFILSKLALGESLLLHLCLAYGASYFRGLGEDSRRTAETGSV